MKNTAEALNFQQAVKKLETVDPIKLLICDKLMSWNSLFWKFLNAKTAHKAGQSHQRLGLSLIHI